MITTVHEGKIAKFENLKIEVYVSREAAGEAAANATAEALQEIASAGKTFGVIFATGASQLATLNALSRIDQLPWDQVQGFNMDDHVGLPADHPASFHAYLRDKVPQRGQMKSFLEVDGTASDIAKMCRAYAEALRAADPQLCLLGIGANGHLAFNDPAEANFNDPFDVRTVHLDKTCRQQQPAEGWFKTYEEVPELAVTLKIPHCSASPGSSFLCLASARLLSFGAQFKSLFRPLVRPPSFALTLMRPFISMRNRQQRLLTWRNGSMVRSKSHPASLELRESARRTRREGPRSRHLFSHGFASSRKAIDKSSELAFTFNGLDASKPSRKKGNQL